MTQAEYAAEIEKVPLPRGFYFTYDREANLPLVFTFKVCSAAMVPEASMATFPPKRFAEGRAREILQHVEKLVREAYDSGETPLGAAESAEGAEIKRLRAILVELRDAALAAPLSQDGLRNDVLFLVQNGDGLVAPDMDARHSLHRVVTLSALADTVAEDLHTRYGTKPPTTAMTDRESEPECTYRHAILFEGSPVVDSQHESVAKDLLTEWGCARGLVPCGYHTQDRDYRIGHGMEFSGQITAPIRQTRLQGKGRQFPGEQLAGFEELVPWPLPEGWQAPLPDAS